MPKTTADHLYTELVELVKKHYNPRPSAITQQFKFNFHVRQPGETVAEYVVELRKLSEHYDFKDTQEDILQDRLVWGITACYTQHCLLFLYQICHMIHIHTSDIFGGNFISQFV